MDCDWVVQIRLLDPFWSRDKWLIYTLGLRKKVELSLETDLK